MLPVMLFDTQDGAEAEAARLAAKFPKWPAGRIQARQAPDVAGKFAVAFVTPKGQCAWHKVSQ